MNIDEILENKNVERLIRENPGLYTVDMENNVGIYKMSEAYSANNTQQFRDDLGGAIRKIVLYRDSLSPNSPFMKNEIDIINSMLENFCKGESEIPEI